MTSLAAVGLVCASWSQVVPYEAHLTGSIYIKQPDDIRLGYVFGLIDMTLRMNQAVNTDGERAFVQRMQKCMNDKNGNDLRDFIDAYVKGDPERLEFAMPSNFRAAIVEGCPA